MVLMWCWNACEKKRNEKKRKERQSVSLFEQSEDGEEEAYSRFGTDTDLSKVVGLVVHDLVLASDHEISAVQGETERSRVSLETSGGQQEFNRDGPLDEFEKAVFVSNGRREMS
jgi:hypothetical protein